ncbi:P-loop containing nucleoside triphosphate hydrolase protein [Poronia punctata]|nr:P-loop containing nucleoside triphosphate hydrolase protein [Poronia punctata]
MNGMEHELRTLSRITYINHISSSFKHSVTSWIINHHCHQTTDISTFTHFNPHNNHNIVIGRAKMPAKRKAPANVIGPAKSGKASAASRPGPSTRRELGSEDEQNPGSPGEPTREEEDVQKAVDRFTLAAYQDNIQRDPIDSASRLFGDNGERDFSYLPLKPDHQSRPICIDPRKGRIIFENFSPIAEQVKDFLLTVAEPLSRQALIHEYVLTPHSIHAAVAVGLLPENIVKTLDRFCKTLLPQPIIRFIQNCASCYGKVKLVIKDTKYFVESNDLEVLQKLLKDPIIGPYRVQGTDTVTSAPSMGSLVIPGTANAAGVRQAQLKKGDTQQAENPEKLPRNPCTALQEDDDDDDQEAVHSFEIPNTSVDIVQKRCLEIQFPMLAEYDFRKDDRNADLEIDIRPGTQIRSYQEKSLSKMFGNGRAKSGIIVLPCGAGKTLVGITAACTIKKSCIVLCTSTISAHQWRQEFLKWTNIRPEDVAVFTADNKSKFPGNSGVIVTTYPMVTQSGKRAYDSQKMMDFLTGREWGLMLLDEVHVVPAQMFRKVSRYIKSHAKLGLTATLVREDDKIRDLNFLIGPKLFEANWMELSQQGHIATVQCAEVWCPMRKEFYEEYLRTPDRTLKANLYVMNPGKIQACQFLIDYHERRGDKILVYSDNVYALQIVAKVLNKPYICGSTGNAERLMILENFMHNPEIKTVFLSKVGDTSLDLPAATCLIQISSHYGSRRQEAQRLGRILRAKRKSDEGFNAFFYSLVSRSTVEMDYSAKRQAFLVDQGYSIKIITQLAELKMMEGLVYNTPRKRNELLQKLVADAKKKVGEVTEDNDDIFYTASGKRARGVKRTAGMLAEHSGGQDVAYTEQGKSANKALNKPPQNPFFKKIAREKEKLKNKR